MNGKHALLVGLVGTWIAACGESRERSPGGEATAEDAGASPALDASAADAGAALDAGTPADAGPAPSCEDPADQTLTVEIPPWEGPHRIHGTIRFGRSVPAGTRWVLALRDFASDDISAANQFKSATLDEAATEVTYVVDNAGGSPLYVIAVVDLSRDGQIGSGDLGGYLDVDPSTPVVDGNQAMLVDVADGELCGADFSLGVLP